MCGEMYRIYNTCSNDIDLKIAMQDFKLQYLKNSYPENLIDDKIREISAQIFKPKLREIKYSEINSDQKYIIVLPYTSCRCSSVEFKMLNLIKAVTPNYHLKFAWTLIEIGRTITPKLKPINRDKIGICYKFTCDCDKQTRPKIDRI